MNNYENIQTLNKFFLRNKVDVNDDIVVGEQKYKFLESTPINVKSLLGHSNQPKTLLYTLSESSQEPALALLYTANNGRLVAKKALYLNINNFRQINEMENAAEKRDIIGDFAEVRFTNLPSSSYIRGKVDTGATISCLHADTYSIDKEKKLVTFKCSYLSNNSLTLGLADMQSVQSANGTDYRPVVEMDININGTVLSKMQFNLNDRSEMDAPILIGQNVLEAGKFLIDPTVNENNSISWPDLSVYLMEAIDMDSLEMLDADMDTDMDTDNEYCDVTKELDDVYTLLKGSDIKLSELMQHASLCGENE